VIKNILWKVDGVLFDTYPAFTYAISKSLNEQGLTMALNVIDGYVHHSIDHCIDTIAQRFKLDPNLLHTRFTETYREIPPDNQLPFPDVRNVCTAVHARRGLNVIVTHRSIKSTQRLLKVHDFSALIDDIFSFEQGFSRKPDSSLLLAALEKHNLDPSKTLLVCGREFDIQAGRAAGVRTCLFGQTELTSSSDLQINAYGQLQEMLTTQ
jgi:phosphoglycolate phosphatase-like HAD superfamily hydrolase